MEASVIESPVSDPNPKAHPHLRILILSSSTGGGHDMRARSIEAWCRQLSSTDRSLTTERYQALEESAGLYAFGVHVYNWIQKKCPWLHHFYFNFLEIFQVSASEKALLGKQKFASKLKSAQPDLIISVHAHTNHAFRAVAKRILPNVKFVTYCGEMFGGYGFSRHWVDPKADAFIGATREICEAAQQLGMPKRRCKHGGFMLAPKFYQSSQASESAKTTLQALGLDPRAFTLLLSTGANGALNHSALIREIARSKRPVQVIALCGRNETALSALRALAESMPHLTICPLGYQEDMFRLLRCSDAIVARPGTGTTSEAILAGCPIIFNTLGGVMPQEWITVKYLRAHGLNRGRIRKPADLIRELNVLTRSPEALEQAKQSMKALQPENTPKDIMQYLIELIREPDAV